MKNPFTEIEPETEAMELAAQVWCRPEQESRTMDVEFATSIAQTFEPVIRERNAWIDTAQMHARNEEFWRNRCHEWSGNVPDSEPAPTSEQVA